MDGKHTSSRCTIMNCQDIRTKGPTASREEEKEFSSQHQLCKLEDIE